MKNATDAIIQPFPPITAPQAMKIAQGQCKRIEEKIFVVYSRKPERFHPYINFPDENCWYVQVSSKQPSVLCSSWMIMISRATGEVLFEGSANDEG